MRSACRPRAAPGHVAPTPAFGGAFGDAAGTLFASPSASTSAQPQPQRCSPGPISDPWAQPAPPFQQAAFRNSPFDDIFSAAAPAAAADYRRRRGKAKADSAGNC